MARLTGAERALLMHGALAGPRPGSNFWSVLCFDDDENEDWGAAIEGLVRRGLLAAFPRRDNEPELSVPSEEEDDIPDIDLTHNYDITPAGRAALEAEKEGG